MRLRHLDTVTVTGRDFSPEITGSGITSSFAGIWLSSSFRLVAKPLGLNDHGPLFRAGNCGPLWSLLAHAGLLLMVPGFVLFSAEHVEDHSEHHKRATELEQRPHDIRCCAARIISWDVWDEWRAKQDVRGDG